METSSLNPTLARVAGHLVIDTEEQQRKLDTLYQSLAQSTLPDDQKQLTRSNLSIEKGDFFFENTIATRRLEALDVLIRKRAETQQAPAYRFFVREVPVREHLLYSSIPEWGVGAKVDHSVGPFLNKDGRQFWYDFFPIEQLVALYMQGATEPILLFKVRTGRVFPNPVNPRIGGSISLTTTYTLLPESIWINARLFTSQAPTGSYTGLRIEGGTLRLSQPPQMINNKLTLTSGTVATVELKLAQPAVQDADEESPFGIDARKMQLQLPTTLRFTFSNQGSRIEEVADARWELYGQPIDFKWDSEQQPSFDTQLQRVVIPFRASEFQLDIRQSASPFHTLYHTTEIAQTAWALPVAQLDITQPTAAAGIGGMLVRGKEGLSTMWQGLKGGGLQLKKPALLVSPGQIFVVDFTAGNPHATQALKLWRDEINTFGTQVNLQFAPSTSFYYTSNANGNELIMTLTNADFQLDRPVQVNGEPPAVRSLNSILAIAANKTDKLIYLFDDNLIQDEGQLTNQDPIIPKQMALALTNALFKVTQPNGCLLFGSLSDDYTTVKKSSLFLTFGMYAYLPTLPDPYAANLGVLRRQIRSTDTVTTGASNNTITSWLICQIKWDVPADDTNLNAVEVSFHFAPLDNQFAGISLGNRAIDAPVASDVATNKKAGDFSFANALASTESNRDTAAIVARGGDEPLPKYENIWEEHTASLRRDMFALLDVSTNADLFGVSFNLFANRSDRVNAVTTTVTDEFPLQVQGMQVVSKGINVKAFTVPQISWEPLINISAPHVQGDPPVGFNYYPNDGGPMHIINTGQDSVAIAPLPLTDYLLHNFKEDTANFAALSFLTLPFGLKALALLQNKYSYTDPNGTNYTRKGSDFLLNAEEFEEQLKGGLQLQLNAGEAFIQGESDMFVGSTLQLNNVLDFTGNSDGDSTLGRTVTEIFNNEFMLQPFNLIRQRGVPLTRIDLSGYGASTFSNWLNPTAAFAETSQSRFDVLVGRCAHEVIQVKSMIYPWGIKVVRTITIFRVSSGYVYRHDSGWRAESSGKFDFRYFVNINPTTKEEKPSPYEVHPGIINGLFNVQNIIETDEIDILDGTMVSDKIVDENGLYVDNPEPGDALPYKLQPVYFDADIEIEGLVSGFVTKKIEGGDKKVVPSKKILGYVQVAPRGIPITKEILRSLVTVQLGSIGGPLDCQIDLANSAQNMRLNRFDFNNSFGANGSDIIFSVAARGNVLLPKDGSWTMVKHERNTGDVSPVPANLSVPVIRPGKVVKDGLGVKIDINPQDALLRIANPTELLRQPTDDTLNFGFLLSTDTQKALFLTPSFELGKKKLFSKTPPLFVDAFRIVNSKAIFPNIGNGETDLGDAISLVKSGTEFLQGNLQDAGKAVWELLDVQDTIDNVKQQGYKLLKKVTDFDLPDLEFELIDVGDGNFRIYIEYKGKNDKGKLDFNINSVATDIAETWKSRMDNIGLVVDLAGIDRLMTIRGNWDSKKGSAASYPQPDIEFSPELQPVIDLLEILQQLQGGDYAGAVASGLKLAMSNKAGSWEYKFEASKEIPVLRFPVPDAVYNAPTTPFKLEAGMKIGAYFNAAIQVTNDANKLLPSAGGLLGFYGRLSVMCVSLAAATVYAIGQVNLDIAADTKIGPSLRMKFGFGAQIVVGLPVVANVSVLFVVGVEIFASAGQVDVTAFMLFQGHAEILGGIVSVTITIEAKGTVSKKAIGGSSRTDMSCQVTFGLDISIFLVINISFSESWQEQRQVA